jgi:choice-of-anchor C domain-containing protein
MAQNLVVNGDFESTAITGGMSFENPGSTVITNWVVGGPSNVDLIRDAWTAQSGYQSIDLNGWGASSIGQSVSLTAGTTYNISFWIAGNTETRFYSTSAVKSMNVYIGTDLLAGNVTFDTTGKSASNMGWEQRDFTFLASTTQNYFLNFVSTMDSPMGIALDNVSITAVTNNPTNNNAVPEPSEWAAMGLLGAGLLGLVVRCRKNNLEVAK